MAQQRTTEIEMFIAKFSNGHTDEYKGKREVRAAWMVTNIQTGKVLGSGHSLDIKKAESRAAGFISEFTPGPVKFPRNAHIGHHKMYAKQAHRLGFASTEEMFAANKAKKEEFAANHKIEVVAI